MQLITDRTQSDIERWKMLSQKGYAGMTAEEKREWDAGMKGTYNYTDLNRVGSAVQELTTAFNELPTELSNYIASLGVAPSDIFNVPYTYPVTTSPKTDWFLADIPTPAQMTTYLNHIRTLKAVITVSAPPVPSSMSNLTYESANAIEMILVAVSGALTALKELKKNYADLCAAGFVRSGTFSSGQNYFPT